MISYEEKSLNAWPALKTLVYKGCLIRLSNGYTKRANSANILYLEKDQIKKIIIFSEKIYKSVNQPTIFKIIDNNNYKKIDSTLQKLNYKKIDLTNVMQNNISILDTTEDNQIDMNVDNKFSDEWIKRFLIINNIKKTDKITTMQMLNNISIELIVGSIKVDNKIIACGYGACEDEYIGFYDIVVDKKYRGQGYGKRLMSGLINKAKEKNIKYAYLQVVASNNIAMDLYEKIGFKKIYTYWYRVK